MQKYVGKTCKGIVSGVTDYGFYVEFPNTCEGLVRFTNDDWEGFDCIDNIRLVGRKSGRILRIGDDVLVKVTNVNVSLGQIDLEEIGSKK